MLFLPQMISLFECFKFIKSIRIQITNIEFHWLISHTVTGIKPPKIFHVASRQDSGAQSRALAAALTGAGGRAEVVSAPGETHMTINRDFGRAEDPEGARAANFIAANAGPASR